MEVACNSFHMNSHTLTFFFISGHSFKSYRHPILLQGDCGRKSEKYGILTVILVMIKSLFTGYSTVKHKDRGITETAPQVAVKGVG